MTKAPVALKIGTVLMCLKNICGSLPNEEYFFKLWAGMMNFIFFRNILPFSSDPAQVVKQRPHLLSRRTATSLVTVPTLESREVTFYLFCSFHSFRLWLMIVFFVFTCFCLEVIFAGEAGDSVGSSISWDSCWYHDDKDGQHKHRFAVMPVFQWFIIVVIISDSKWLFTMI